MSRTHFQIAILAAVFCTAAFLLSACSPQERAGRNLRPFNTPADWELNPYRDSGALQN